MTEYVMVMTVAKDDAEANRIVDAVLHKKLAACANIISGMQSKYWWRGVIETRNEKMILFKTKTHLVQKVKELILIKHSYEIAEVAVMPIIDGSMHYLSWIDQEVERQSD